MIKDQIIVIVTITYNLYKNTLNFSSLWRNKFYNLYWHKLQQKLNNHQLKDQWKVILDPNQYTLSVCDTVHVTLTGHCITVTAGLSNGVFTPSEIKRNSESKQFLIFSTNLKLFTLPFVSTMFK